MPVATAPSAIATIVNQAWAGDADNAPPAVRSPPPLFDDSNMPTL